MIVLKKKPIDTKCSKNRAIGPIQQTTFQFILTLPIVFLAVSCTVPVCIISYVFSQLIFSGKE
jgi:hypothetical protein